jgi:hypothetical protein
MPPSNRQTPDVAFCGESIQGADHDFDADLGEELVGARISSPLPPLAGTGRCVWIAAAASRDDEVRDAKFRNSWFLPFFILPRAESRGWRWPAEHQLRLARYPTKPEQAVGAGTCHVWRLCRMEGWLGYGIALLSLSLSRYIYIYISIRIGSRPQLAIASSLFSRNPFVGGISATTCCCLKPFSGNPFDGGIYAITCCCLRPFSGNPFDGGI